MTAEELRALDVRIHREVMGRDCEYDATASEPDWFDTITPHQVLPRYSTGIAAAWEVVERLCADNRHTVSVHDSTAGADCTVTRAADGHYVFACEDWCWSPQTRAPLAICLAALKVVNGGT